MLHVQNKKYKPSSRGFDPDIPMYPRDTQVGTFRFVIPADCKGDPKTVTLNSNKTGDWTTERDRLMSV